MMKLISWMTRHILWKVSISYSVASFSPFTILLHRPSDRPTNLSVLGCREIFCKGISYSRKIILHNINPLQIWILEKEIASLNYNTLRIESKEWKKRWFGSKISDLYVEENGNEANLIFNIQFPFISIFIPSFEVSLLKCDRVKWI